MTIDRAVVKINAYVTDREHCAAYMQARDKFIAAGVDEAGGEAGSATPRLPASTLIVVSSFSKPGNIHLRPNMRPNMLAETHSD